MSSIRYYCTYFDQRYLSRFLALYSSLKQHSREFSLWALCFDDLSYSYLEKLNLLGVRLISHEEFSRGDEKLKNARQNRSLVEYYFTCSPSLPLFVFRNDLNIEQVTYLDADLYFFNDPELIYAEIGSASLAIIPHRFSEKMRWLEENGIFNVGWLTFRRDEEGLSCLERWRNQCLEWCFDRIEGKRFADQGYLNDWPEIYRNLVVIQQKGANLAPWNISNYQLTRQNGCISISGDPLIFFHFQSLACIQPRLYKLNFTKYKIRASRFVKKEIYKPYIKILESMRYEVVNIGKVSRIRNPTDALFLDINFYGFNLKNFIITTFHLIKEILKGDYIYLWGW